MWGTKHGSALPGLRRLAVGFVVTVLVVPLGTGIAHAANSWSPTASLTGCGDNGDDTRSAMTATLLRNGKVLVAGGTSAVSDVKSAELYDPAAGTWACTGDMNEIQEDSMATLLPSSGDVLVAGGQEFGPALANAELYDPTSGAWTETTGMNVARYDAMMTPLQNGQVLVVGGLDSNSNSLASAELYDASTETWTVTGSMQKARFGATATLLSNGDVLVAGGFDSSSNAVLSTAEVFDPSTGAWSATAGTMNGARYEHTATLLPDGTVLVAGGLDANFSSLASADVYDPSTGTWTTTSGTMTDARYGQTATLLPDGTVLAAGGFGSNGTPLASAELYDPSTATWSPTASLGTPRVNHTMTLLQDGAVLVVGGSLDGYSIGSAELYPSISASGGLALTATEGDPLSGTVATFTDVDPDAVADEYSATIDWGDGSATDTGTVAQNADLSFSVGGSHTYAGPGSYTISVTITDAAVSGNTATVTDSATISDAALSASDAISSPIPQSFVGATATFTDGNTSSTAADFTATIDWGDGQTSDGTVTGSAGSYSVNGIHAYATTGYFEVKTHIVDIGGSTADADTTNVLVYGVPTTGSFVISSQNVANGTSVTFWGAKWANNNPLTTRAPGRFYGFEDQALMPDCGADWLTNPRNTLSPPDAPLPAYMLVVASSQISSTRTRALTGDTVHEVVIQTDAGYGPNPRSAGTGTVVAQLC